MRTDQPAAAESVLDATAPAAQIPPMMPTMVPKVRPPAPPARVTLTPVTDSRGMVMLPFGPAFASSSSSASPSPARRLAHPVRANR